MLDWSKRLKTITSIYTNQRYYRSYYWNRKTFIIKKRYSKIMLNIIFYNNNKITNIRYSYIIIKSTIKMVKLSSFCDDIKKKLKNIIFIKTIFINFKKIKFIINLEWINISTLGYILGLLIKKTKTKRLF